MGQTWIDYRLTQLTTVGDEVEGPVSQLVSSWFPACRQKRIGGDETMHGADYIMKMVQRIEATLGQRVNVAKGRAFARYVGTVVFKHQSDFFCGRQKKMSNEIIRP